jgi:hypothetical protein
MDTREITKTKYCKMYWALKEVHALTSSYQFGSGYLPQIFTESLCRYLFGLSHYQKGDKKFDAIERKGETVEIKATLTNTGFTTINPTSKFTYMYWMHFNFNKNKLYVYKIKGEYFYTSKYILDIIKSNESSKRVTVNLNKVFSNSMLISICTFAKV